MVKWGSAGGDSRRRRRKGRGGERKRREGRQEPDDEQTDTQTEIIKGSELYTSGKQLCENKLHVIKNYIC